MMTKYQTEKRKANVGERILIKNAKFAGGMYENGDVRTVSKLVGDTGLHVKEHARGLYHHEYEVIVGTKPRKSERISALETEVARQREVIAELKAKVGTLEIAKEPFSITKEIERLANAYPPTKSANKRRADVIKRAKAFVANKHSQYVSNGLVSLEFVVNPEKRTVVAIIHGLFSKRIRSKGIAKCDPSDVFNADIGKAIALARALGVDVPQEFVKAVQPTEIAVGQRIYYTRNFPSLTVIESASKPRSQEISVRLAREYESSNRILEDTDAVYE